MLWDKQSELCQCEPKSPESNAGSYTNSLPLAVFNLCFRFTLDLHKIRFSPSPFVRRRVEYKLLKTWHGYDMPQSRHARASSLQHRAKQTEPFCIPEPQSHILLTLSMSYMYLLNLSYLHAETTQCYNHFPPTRSPGDAPLGHQMVQGCVPKLKCSHAPQFPTTLENGPGPVPAFGSSDFNH